MLESAHFTALSPSAAELVRRFHRPFFSECFICRVTDRESLEVYQSTLPVLSYSENIHNFSACEIATVLTTKKMPVDFTSLSRYFALSRTAGQCCNESIRGARLCSYCQCQLLS